MKIILGKILDKIKGLSKEQKIIWGVGSASFFVVLCLGIGMVYFAVNSKTVEVDKPNEKIEIIEEETEEPIVEEVTVELKKILFSGASIAKDLKIKIMDETGALVTGTPFKITVTAQKDAQAKEYADDDVDGIIYITNMVAGQYTVKLQDIEGFVVAENDIVMTVKDKIEYKKVDVKNEIKKESEVNVKKEDALSQKPKDEHQVVNTVELLETTKKETPIAKEQVDSSNFTKATASETKKEENIIDDTKIFVPQSVVLYNQGGEKSKTFLLEVNVVGEKQIIQGYLWETEVEGVVSFPENSEETVVLSAVQEGTTKLYLTVTYANGVTRSVQSSRIEIEVTVSDFTDDKTQLRSTQGELLYLDKVGEQPATLKDYSKAEELYAMKYTGWTELDEAKYYFDSNNKAVTGMQVIGGVRYIFDEKGVLLKTTEQKGIDVSKWNGTIDWNAVANAGIDFAIIRVGYRGYSAGTLVEDPYFKQNIAGATKAGIKVGIYFFTQAITEAEAVEEASMAISLVSGYQLQLPIYFDTEDVDGNGRADKMSVAARTAITKAFCETVKNAGYMPGVYASTSWYNNQLNASELADYDIWVAHYANVCGFKGRYHMWQYTSSGSVPGINGRVDLNIRYVGVAAN